MVNCNQERTKKSVDFLFSINRQPKLKDQQNHLEIVTELTFSLK